MPDLTVHDKYRALRSLITAAETNLTATTMDVAVSDRDRIRSGDSPASNLLELVGMSDCNENLTLVGDLWANRRSQPPWRRVCTITWTRGTMQVVPDIARDWNRYISDLGTTLYYFDTAVKSNDNWAGNVAIDDSGNNLCVSVTFDTRGYTDFYFCPTTVQVSSNNLLLCAKL